MANKLGELEDDVKWRQTNKLDVAISGFGVFVMAVFSVFIATNPEYSSSKKLILGALWTVFLLLQIRTFGIVLRKYRNGDEIRRGIFANVTEARDKK